MIDAPSRGAIVRAKCGAASNDGRLPVTLAPRRRRRRPEGEIELDLLGLFQRAAQLIIVRLIGELT